ncbi:MAG TPA: MauE/DoxX family redox-associated membrane protein [Sphingobacteriaceae bacterium]
MKRADPAAIGEVLVWAVPVVELFTAGLLVFEKTRLKGLIASLILLLAFTVYIALIQFNYFGYVPCSCGGVISKLSWEGHFLFNMVFIVLAGIAHILRQTGTSTRDNDA